MGNNNSQTIKNITDISIINEKFKNVEFDDCMKNFINFCSDLNKDNSNSKTNAILIEIYQISRYIVYQMEKELKEAEIEDNSDEELEEEKYDIITKNFSAISDILENYIGDFSKLKNSNDKKKLITHCDILCKKFKEYAENIESLNNTIDTSCKILDKGINCIEITTKVMEILNKIENREIITKEENALLTCNQNITSKEVDNIYEKKNRGEPLTDNENKLIENFKYKQSNEFPDLSIEQLQKAQKICFDAIKNNQSIPHNTNF